MKAGKSKKSAFRQVRVEPQRTTHQPTFGFVVTIWNIERSSKAAHLAGGARTFHRAKGAERLEPRQLVLRRLSLRPTANSITTHTIRTAHKRQLIQLRSRKCCMVMNSIATNNSSTRQRVSAQSRQHNAANGTPTQKRKAQQANGTHPHARSYKKSHSLTHASSASTPPPYPTHLHQQRSVHKLDPALRDRHPSQLKHIVQCVDFSAHRVERDAHRSLRRVGLCRSCAVLQRAAASKHEPASLLLLQQLLLLLGQRLRPAPCARLLNWRFQQPAAANDFVQRRRQ